MKKYCEIYIDDKWQNYTQLMEQDKYKDKRLVDIYTEQYPFDDLIFNDYGKEERITYKSPKYACALGVACIQHPDHIRTVEVEE